MYDIDDLERVVKENADKRAELQSQIVTLAHQRDGYIAEELKKRKGSDASLDDQIYATVKAQAAKKGLSYDAAAAH